MTDWESENIDIANSMYEVLEDYFYNPEPTEEDLYNMQHDILYIFNTAHTVVQEDVRRVFIEMVEKSWPGFTLNLFGH
jgi:hypothetical protein|tara:strand:- start:1497 stop:1730 length:234 start_codon:yes stop_codon:yes gene_type:complete